MADWRSIHRAARIAIGLLAIGSSRAGLAEPLPVEHPNVLLLTVDCLRPDHLSLSGYGRPTSPQLDAFAEEAFVFENAFATGAWTSPGIVSMLTGYYPPVHAQNGRHSSYDAELASPLRILQEEGYTTWGRSATGANYGGLGLEHEVGAEAFDAFVRKRAAAAEADPEAGPFFAWLHSKEPHLPYRPGERNAGRFLVSPTETPGLGAAREHALIFRDPPAELPFEHAGAIRFEPGDAEAIRALYDETVRDADDHLGRAFAALRETGLWERTIVIVSADHGEELLEHGWIGHASTGYDGKLTDELVRIPLLVRVPGRPAGRSAALVQGVDLMPSLFEWLGLETARVSPAMQGVSIAPLADGRAARIRDQVFLQTTRKGWTTPKREMQRRVTAVRSLDRKLIWIPAEAGMPARLEGYDLVADPGELQDLHAASPERFADLAQARARWDRENRLHAAALLLPAGQVHVHRQQEALAKGDLLGGLHAWRRLHLLHRTWGFEEQPFFEDEQAGRDWRSLYGRASAALSAALADEAGSLGTRALRGSVAAPLSPRSGAAPSPQSRAARELGARR